MNLTLDENFKPLTHAVGSEGDIVIEYSDLTLMLEATLMNKNSQKRRELEPVIRHATNLTVQKPDDVFTIFVADELDNNVINIFRAMTQVELESTQSPKTTAAVNIFALSINELDSIISNGVKYSKVISVLQDEYRQNYGLVKIDWREYIAARFIS